MGYIIGKMTILFLLFHVSIWANISLEVRVTDEQGNVLEQIGAGQPFTIEVILHDASSSIQAPTISGIEHFNARRTGVFMTNINGKSTNKYSYTLRIDTPGNYILGPAHIQVNGALIQSDTIAVRVDTHAQRKQSPTGQSKNSQAHKAFLQLSLNKERVVVGEKVQAQLRFYYDSPDLLLKQINPPQVNDIAMESASAGVHGTQSLNGIIYNYVEWTWHVCPLKEGIITLPAYNAHYQLPVVNNGPSNIGFFMFTQQSALKNIYSNACTLRVDPVPLYKGRPVDAVGEFVALKATVTPTLIKEGEAAIYTLLLEGDTYFDTILAPALQHMPTALKWYESQQHLDKSLSSSHQIKRFEYIIQGSAKGDWEIPKQTFTYFDTNTRTCKKLETVGQLITILPGVLTTALPKTPISLIESRDEDSFKTSSNVLPLITTPWLPVAPPFSIPLRIFLLLLALPILIEIIIYLQRAIKRYYDIRRYSINPKNAFKNAYKKLARAQHNNEYKKVYPLFVELMSVRRGLPLSSLTHISMEQEAVIARIGLEVQHEWQNFLKDAAAYCYNNTPTSSSLFWSQAYSWLERLQKGGL